MQKPLNRNLSLRFCFICLSIVLMLSCGQFCHAGENQIVQNVIEDGSPTDKGGSIRQSPKCSSAKISINDKIIRGGLLYDMSADCIVWQKNSHESFPIASLTKMMVCLIAIEDIYAGKVKWDALVKVTRESTRVGGSAVSLRPDYSITVKNLINAALISSGNDATYLLAQHLGGTEKRFVDRMNRRAMELGMTTTRFSNSTGMPAGNKWRDNHASPMDLLLLCKEIYNHKELLSIAGTSRMVFAHGGRTIKLRNHNQLVADYVEVDGFKTGFTQNAKFCLAATAEKNDRRLIAIALGADSRFMRNRFVKNLLCEYYEALGMEPLQARNKTNYDKAEKSLAKDASCPVTHRITKGDTLYGISKTYRCSVAQLKEWNGLTGNAIKPGQRLKIYPKSSSSPKADVSSVVYYTVKPGDTLWLIAKKHTGVSVKEIMRANNIRHPRDLKTGTTLKIGLDRS